VLFCVGKNTKTGQLIGVGARFCVSILHEGQRDLSTYFGGAWKSDTPPPFAFVNRYESPASRVARLPSAAVSRRFTKAGTTGSSWGYVGAFQRREDGVAPLVFHNGRYVGLATEHQST